MPLQAFKNSYIWIACTALVHYAVVVWQQACWVKLQFDLCQDVPKSLKNLSKSHKVDMWGHTDENKEEKHAN